MTITTAYTKNLTVPRIREANAIAAWDEAQIVGPAGDIVSGNV